MEASAAAGGKRGRRRCRRGSAILYILFLVLSVSIIVLLTAEIGMATYRQEYRYEDGINVQRAWEGILTKIDADAAGGNLTVPATYTLSMNGVTGSVTVADNSSILANTNIATATLTTTDSRTYAESAMLPKLAGLSGSYYWTNGAGVGTVAAADAFIFANITPTGTFVGQSVNYSGSDTGLIKSFLGTDASSFSGTNDNMEDGIVKQFGSITTPAANTVIQMTCDDGAILSVDGDNYLINLDGTRFGSASGTVTIPSAGTYPVCLTYFNHKLFGIGSAKLQLQWNAGSGYVAIPSSALSLNSQQWAYNGSASSYGNGVQLVSGLVSQAGSAWLKTKQAIGSFHAAFTIVFSGATAEGATFCIQNQGSTALGTNGSNLGYGGISNSAAVKLDLYKDGGGDKSNSTSLYTGGASPTGGTAMASPTLTSGDPIHCVLAYDGTTLTETVTDEVTGGSYSTSYTVNLSTAVGASTAYVGFTASTGSSTCTAQVLDFSFGP